MYVKAIVEYAGTDYFGFQVQPKKKTIQGEIEKALKKIYKKDIRIKYASRTDSGVHAKGQLISFKVPYDQSKYNIKRALNISLPEDIIIKKIAVCDNGFDPRQNARAKLYIYRILNKSDNDYILKDYSWHIPSSIDWIKVNKALKLIMGRHDFELLSSNNEQKKRSFIQIDRTYLKKNVDFYEIGITASHFLTYMIRFMVGMVIAIGRDKKTFEDLEKMLKGSGDRCNICAPARGLELKRVYLNNDL